MIFKAVLSNKAHPEYGAATIPFPIPDGQYGFSKGEGLQFQAMASVLGLSDVKDLINLTFARFVP